MMLIRHRSPDAGQRIVNCQPDSIAQRKAIHQAAERYAREDVTGSVKNNRQLLIDISPEFIFIPVIGQRTDFAPAVGKAGQDHILVMMQASVRFGAITSA